MTLDYAAASVEKQSAGRDDGFKNRVHGLVENKLVAALRRGQAAAFDELWRTHANKILRITYRITRNREDAEDALQDSFLRAFVHIQGFDGRSSFSTWLIRIAINSALMIVRKKSAALEISIDNPGDRGGTSEFKKVSDRAPDPEAHYAEREREEILRDAVRALRPTIRQAIELQKFGERSVKETAKIMGLSLTAAKTRLYHAKVELRQSLTPASFQKNVRAANKLHTAPVA